MSNVTVKVEVWDVVDKGKPKGKPGRLRINFEEEVNVSAVSPNGAAGVNVRLDAETIDVMKGTHAVIFMVDPTKKWTFDYVRREMPKVPPNVWVLIVVCRRRSSCCSSLTHSLTRLQIPVQLQGPRRQARRHRLRDQGVCTRVWLARRCR